jgi:hypothetical protein
MMEGRCAGAWPLGDYSQVFITIGVLVTIVGVVTLFRGIPIGMSVGSSPTEPV